MEFNLDFWTTQFLNKVITNKGKEEKLRLNDVKQCTYLHMFMPSKDQTSSESILICKLNKKMLLS